MSLVALRLGCVHVDGAVSAIRRARLSTEAPGGHAQAAVLQFSSDKGSSKTVSKCNVCEAGRMPCLCEEGRRRPQATIRSVCDCGKAAFKFNERG
jgi:hypothetical protein